MSSDKWDPLLLQNEISILRSNIKNNKGEIDALRTTLMLLVSDIMKSRKQESCGDLAYRALLSTERIDGLWHEYGLATEYQRDLKKG